MNAKSVTLEEFLANDYESYEDIKGCLVPILRKQVTSGECNESSTILWWERYTT